MLNPASSANPEKVLRVADGAGLHDHTIFQTSGSSGGPKFVCLSQSALETSANAVNQHLSAGNADTWLLALPEFHVGGFAISLRARLSGSSVIVLSGRWSVVAFMMLAPQATLVSLVPAQLFDLVEAEQKSPPSLRAVIIGGGRLSPALRTRAENLGWPILETYGMTEAGSQIACEERILPIWRTRTDETDRLSISGDALFSGYISENTFAPSGEWFETSDLVHLENDQLRFIGRVDDVVKVLGELVNIPRLEEKLPKTCAILALPHPRLENELVLVCENSIDRPGEVMEQFNATRPGYERLSRFLSIEMIPRSPLGKILRKKLRDAAGV